MRESRHIKMIPWESAETILGDCLIQNGIDGDAARLDRIHENELGCIKHFLKFVGPLPTCSNECWLWRGGTDTSGYGQICWNHQRYAAHRLSYELFVGQIMPGLCVCHDCDTPRCVNPEHLWLGTHADNMHDLAVKGRGRAKLGTATESFIGEALKRPTGSITPHIEYLFVYETHKGVEA